MSEVERRNKKSFFGLINKTEYYVSKNWVRENLKHCVSRLSDRLLRCPNCCCETLVVERKYVNGVIVGRVAHDRHSTIECCKECDHFYDDNMIKLEEYRWCKTFDAVQSAELN